MTVLCKTMPRLRGKTLGIVGCGRIGIAMAMRAKAFGLDIVFYDPYAVPGLDKALGIRLRQETLDGKLLHAKSPFVSLHCYLDDLAAHHLINAAALARDAPKVRSSASTRLAAAWSTATPWSRRSIPDT